MGTVCRVCDRKFILRDSYQQYAGKIAYYEKEFEQLEEEVRVRDKQKDDLHQELWHYR